MSDVDDVDCWPSALDHRVSNNAGLALGTILVIAACFVSTTGVNLQKIAHTRNETLPMHLRKNYAQLLTWQLGMSAMVIGSLMDFVALPFLPQSRIAVLGSVTLVANVIVTPIFLGEELTRFDYIGCAITVTGCSIATYFGASVEAELTPECMWEHAKATCFVIYGSCLLLLMSFLGFFIAGHHAFKGRMRYEMEQLQHMCETKGMTVPASEPQTSPQKNYTLRGLEAARVSIEDEIEQEGCFPWYYVPTRKHPKFYPVVYTAFAGTAGAQSIMFAKASLELLKSGIRGQSSAWYLFICVPPFLLCLWAQVNYLNQALKLYDALFVVPVYQTFWIIMGILCGLIFYQEYRNFTTARTVAFVLGCLINLLGMYVLAQRNKNHQLPKESKTELKVDLPDLEQTLLSEVEECN